jgi:hypothetical protein
MAGFIGLFRRQTPKPHIEGRGTALLHRDRDSTWMRDVVVKTIGQMLDEGKMYFYGIGGQKLATHRIDNSFDNSFSSFQ